jgi:hypothetical protein
MHMKNVALKNRIFFLLLLFSMGFGHDLLAQEKENPYRFEGNDVIFVFDVRNYAKELLGENALKVDFADLGIYEVAVTGEFNNWSRKGWKMEKKDDFTFILRKHLEDFNDAFPIDFRYIINGRFIADAEGDITDPRQFKDDFIEDIYKVDLSVIKISEKGNVLFSLRGYNNRKEVILAGSFNGWNEHAIKMNKVEGGWELRAELPPGRYEYKFIADGEWLHDPSATQQVRNEHGTLNSVLLVTVPVTFSLPGYSNAKKVILAGSFNNWNEHKEEMKLQNGTWISTLNLAGGKHTYKFIVDGNWMTDPNNPLKENDGYGNINSVLFVH